MACCPHTAEGSEAGARRRCVTASTAPTSRSSPCGHRGVLHAVHEGVPPDRDQ